MLLFNKLPQMYFDIDPESRGGGGGADDGGDGGDQHQQQQEDWMPNQHAEGDAEDEITVKRSEYNDLHGFRKGFGKDYQFDEAAHKERETIDPSEYKQMRQFIDTVESNPQVYDVVKEMLSAQREKRDPDFSQFTQKQLKDAQQALDDKAAGGDAGKGGDPAGKKEGETQSEADQRLANLEAAEKKREAAEMLKQFDTKYDKEIAAVTGDTKLTEREKSALRQRVESAYYDDDNLTLEDMNKILKQEYAEIEAYRKEITGDTHKSLLDGDDDSPDALTGGGGSQIPGKKKDHSNTTSHERVTSIAESLKDAIS